MENVKQPLDSEKVKKATEEAVNTMRMISAWAQQQGIGILKKMELERQKHTLSLHWPKVRQGWLGGFVSGVQAGFELGYKTANQLDEKVLAESKAEQVAPSVATPAPEAALAEAAGQERLPGL